jgi:hypothetical protein
MVMHRKCIGRHKTKQKNSFLNRKLTSLLRTFSLSLSLIKVLRLVYMVVIFSVCLSQNSLLFSLLFLTRYFCSWGSHLCVLTSVHMSHFLTTDYIELGLVGFFLTTRIFSLCANVILQEESILYQKQNQCALQTTEKVLNWDVFHSNGQAMVLSARKNVIYV